MYTEVKQQVKTDTTIILLLLRLKLGFRNISCSSKLLVRYAISFVLIFLICILLWKNSLIQNNVADVMLSIFWVIVLFLLNFAAVIVIGNPLLQARRQSNAFRRIGLFNRAGEPPALLYVSNSNGSTIYEYYASGIPLKQFIDNQSSIEATLNAVVLDIRQGKDRSRVLISLISGENQLPDKVDWSDRYLSRTDSEIVLGISETGLYKVDLNNTPHIQCGGVTGCGKSVLLKCVLYQLYRKGADIILCDFKGLLDFSQLERNRYDCVTTKEDLASELHKLIEEMNSRKKVFSSECCSNIREYNARHPESPYRRIMLASDEIAYAFQRKGLVSAEDKALVNDIEASMSLIAQQGRFAGIHLWLSTQRGDADTIPPQIRSNLPVRICGRASDILSRVTIDSSIASEIPKSIHGRFATDSEEFFQAFYYTERSNIYGIH